MTAQAKVVVSLYEGAEPVAKLHAGMVAATRGERSSRLAAHVQCWMALLHNDIIPDVVALRARVDGQARLIERQADHIAMLERLLAANGPRAQARLRAPWWRWRRLRGLFAGMPF